MQVIVHGGAGDRPDDPDERQAVLDSAADRGAEEPTPLDAVDAAVGVLERSPRFNAGTGGARQSDGSVRTDAGVMTSDRAVGAACSMPGVERAVRVARVVLEETPHVLISGDHAVAVAENYGVETAADLLTDRTRERWEQTAPPDGAPSEQLPWIREHFGATGETMPGDPSDHDTVGAVATDGDRVAAATSTGGRWYALAGRVGDVPQVGGGFFATSAGGASATGAGEAIATDGLARRTVGLLDDGVDAAAAADRSIEAFDAETDAEAGVIVADRDGSLGSAFNSAAMQTSTAGSVE